MQIRLKSSRARLLGGIGVAAVAASCVAAPAEARSYHHHARSAHRHGVADRTVAVRHHPAEARWVGKPAIGAGVPAENSAAASSLSDLVAEARKWLGGRNPTSRRTLWCASFVNFVLARTGHSGTGSDAANSFASYGHRVSGPQVGAIAVMARKGGGHVGVVSGVDAAGNPVIISGNNANQVREAPYRGGRIYAYVMP
jgi:uncharacterized protein (TIGR02594 family)